MMMDLIIASAVLLIATFVGLGRRRCAIGPVERFTAGRQASWLTLGASMAASGMSADTPLLIAGAVYMDGMAGNWFWWAGAPGVLATLFFFTRLWRRSGVLTEVEIFHLRYGDGPLARRYRMFQAVLEGLVQNVLILASNAYAFGLILTAMLRRWHGDADPYLAATIMVACFFGASGYALLVGFRGLVRSDAAVFLLSLIAGGVLAVCAVAGIPGGLAHLQGLPTSRAGASVFAMWPAHDPLAPLLLLSLGWWHSAPGRGLLVQRIAASRDERSAMLMVATFACFQYLLRPWGWYLIGAAALFYLPAHANPDVALPTLAGSLLPNGLFGLILAVTALAFMGCVNSRLNFGASYVVNDVALVLRPPISESITHRVEIAVVVGLTILAVMLALLGVPSSIRALYQFLTMMLAGTGFVAIARWYWWRTSILCEIASLASSAIVATISLLLADISRPVDFAVAVAVNFVVGATVTITTSLVGRATTPAILREFYDRVGPGGPGWRDFAPAGVKRPSLPYLQWILANGALFALILACVRALEGKVADAAVAGAVAILLAGAAGRLITVIDPSRASAGNKNPA